MPYYKLYYHIVWGTKNRQGIILPDFESDLYRVMAAKVIDLDGIVHAIGGVEDHVHLLVGLRATHRLADVLKDIKSSSSKWVHEELKKPLFSWQEGYGAFTVSASQIEVVKNYIANQEEHHRKKTFQEEYLEFLKQSGVEYDEKYLW